MADDTSPDITDLEASIADVSLTSTPIAPKDDAPAASEPAEQGTDEAAATDSDQQDESAESEGNDSEPKEQPAEQPEPAKTDEEQPAQDPAEARKQEAQRAYLDRQRTRQQVTQQIDETYGPKTADDLVNEGLDQNAAQIEALRQEFAFKEQRAQIAEMNANLQAEAVNVLNDFPVFNPNSKQYDAEFTTQVQEAYKTASRLQTDERGIVLNAEVPLYDFHKQMASIYSRGASKGTQQGQQEAVKMLSRTEAVGGSSSTSGNTSNDLADLEERLGNVVIT